MHTKSALALILSISLTYLSACDATKQTEINQATAKAGKGINPANVDTTVAPCENFFLFANGGWLKNNPIPASESRWGSFNELADRNNAILRKLLNEAAKESATRGSLKQKVGDFYHSAMDSASIEQAGIRPLQGELDKIESIKNTNDLLNVIAHGHKTGANPVYVTYVGQDEKNSTQYILYLYQGGLGLPDRDYYLKDDARSKKIREAYHQHIQKMLTLAGTDSVQAKKQAQTILQLETRLAKASMSRVDMRDPYKTYNKFSLPAAGNLTPNLSWANQFKQMGAPAVDSVIIAQPKFFKEVNRMMSSVPLNDWKTYLRWQVIHDAASALPHAFVQENFNFYGTTLSGTKEMQPRWKRMVRSTDGALGEALGQLYVKEAFPPKAKEKAMEMVKNLQAAFKEHINRLEWMSDTTKRKAMEKLSAFAVKIGYPDKWKDYGALEISRDSYLQNLMRTNEFAVKQELAKLGKPVDRTEWGMTPPTVNAYYNPSMNEIVFPAGILQPPFFDPEADDAVNYGGMGAVIGHEFTHGFDDQGRQYDAKGNLKEWWTNTDAGLFKKRADVVVKQFGNYKVLDSIPVNGQLTLGENLADLGGLAIAYTALQKALEKSNPGKIDGFTPEQRFFLAWSQIWRTNIRDEALSQQVIVDPHSPAQYRVNGPLANLPQFQQAFGCKPSDPMVRSDSLQAQIW